LFRNELMERAGFLLGETFSVERSVRWYSS
jgi:hypothetical protein